MAPRTRPGSVQPKAAPRSRAPARDRRRAPLAESHVARKDACVATLQSCRNGADRAENAYNELSNKHATELDTEYQLHRSDQGALRNALVKLCGKHQVSYTQLHYAFTRGQGAPHVPPGTRNSASAPHGGGKAFLISLDAKN